MLLDVGLPDIDGYEVCRRLKADARTSDIGVIFVTARGAAEDVALGFDMGAVEYIAKPYNLPMVMVAVDALLRTSQRGGFSVAYDDFAHAPPARMTLPGFATGAICWNASRKRSKRRIGSTIPCPVSLWMWMRLFRWTMNWARRPWMTCWSR